MKIQYLKNNEIDIDRWDGCVRQSIQSLPYAFSFYLNVVAPSFSGIVLNNYEAILPLPTKKKIGIDYVYRPLVCQQLGIVSKKKLDDIATAAMVKAIPSKIKYINYCVSTKLSDKGNFIPKDNYIIHLDQTYPQLLANYKYNTRRQIKIALKNKPNIVEDVAIDSVIDLMQQTFNKKSVLSNKDFLILKKLFEMLSKHRLAHSLGILNEENKLCAVVFYIKTNKRIINLINASTTIARKNGWVAVLIDHVIKKHSNANYIFDFEGSNLPTVARFFKSFGSEKVIYYNWQWNRFPFPLRLFK